MNITIINKSSEDFIFAYNHKLVYTQQYQSSFIEIKEHQSDLYDLKRSYIKHIYPCYHLEHTTSACMYRYQNCLSSKVHSSAFEAFEAALINIG